MFISFDSKIKGPYFQDQELNDAQKSDVFAMSVSSPGWPGR
ncbi:hypothetical protein predicted by Glimmer/Critica [Bdellovibrio bacteriovorus HD100]|uniref:Uncharacterized protein n=1 Tax=Bdellovibrio bacteriovorus (strain ATCC 15356 / DSM 50701 / NCIMB 9529 / HD100) TaxID=264462 RepID=Q6MNB5_BDEBA|nr:hypothetical protein predicted by Glimmer/Critica [Bdellovibrio bacteriovorus HD100]